MLKKLSQDAPVVTLTVVGTPEDVGAAAMKAMPSHCRYRYKQPVVYTLEDGTQFASNIAAPTKPKLASRIADHFRYVANRMMWANQWQDGAMQYWSHSIRFSIGG